MGTIIKDLTGRVTSIAIERRVDDVEIQQLRFDLTNETWIGTESGNSLHLFGRDKDHNIIDIEIPISTIELKDLLGKLERN